MKVGDEVFKDSYYYLSRQFHDSLADAITAFKLRSGIKAMFKDCKTGGYNLESTYADGQRLTALIYPIFSKVYGL
ncbi:hypothetical protein [Fischerella thermalis]|uniref:hypothetical protein n=1 Tax=Fischerella thermalis TaxID=372787 RepID=UPI002155F19D|nr:hypothetical protein [Fischerella thermalis]